uniref:MHC class I-like antigen recognition-like domain-containing protein n=1 Tax=Laticauda laticaudata TaxID=8630 RepID=A0A8C5S1U3_LATLA
MALPSPPLFYKISPNICSHKPSTLALSTFSHSMKYFYTSISDPSQGLPQFVTVGYVDGQPRVSWIEKVGKEDPQYWERETQISHGYEEAFRRNLGTLRIHYNQSEGLHIIEVMCVCEFRRDRSKGGVWQCGYEGMTFITFNKETFTWVPPWVMLVEDGMEMYVCHLDGFYPRDIDRTLPWVCGTQRGWDLPYWLSIRIDPKERGRYRCHVEHDGLPEPLDLALEGESCQQKGSGGSSAFLKCFKDNF